MAYIDTIKTLYQLAKSCTTSPSARYGVRVKQGEFASAVVALLNKATTSAQRIYIEDVEAAASAANNGNDQVIYSVYAGRLGVLPALKRAIAEHNRGSARRIKLVADDFIYIES
jgi:hypothetical protein